MGAIGQRLNILILADQDFTNDQPLVEQMRSAMEGRSRSQARIWPTLGFKPGFQISDRLELQQRLTQRL